MQNQNTTTITNKGNTVHNASFQNNKRRMATVLHQEWDTQYNPVPVVKAAQGWNKDYPDLERLFH